MIDEFPLRIVAAHSVVPGRSRQARRATSLAGSIARSPRSRGTPTLVMMHHPPFATGLPHFDVSAWTSVDGLERVIARHPQVERILCGHVHRAVQIRFGGTIASACPSTAHQVAVDLRPDGEDSFTLEPPGFQLHRWNGRTLFSYTRQRRHFRRALSVSLRCPVERSGQTRLGRSLKGITKCFGTTPVLRHIDLDIADGEFLTLVGPSGCGKSTLLRIIAGLERQDAGTRVDRRRAGRSPAAARAPRRDGVPELRALSAHVGVREHRAAADDGAAQRCSERCRCCGCCRRAGARVMREIAGEVRGGRRAAAASSRSSRAGRRSCRAASGSASRSAARWCAIPTCS